MLAYGPFGKIIPKGLINEEGGTPDALVDDPDAEETEAEAAGIAQDANREVCCKSGHFARGGGCAGAILTQPKLC
jgi:hypothetical protein